MLDVQLPIRFAPLVGESGLGYCLRLAHANGGGLVNLRRALGMKDREAFRQWHAPALARLVEVGKSDLGWILPQAVGRGAGTRLSCYGSRFRSRSALRLRFAQVCPACVSTYRFSKAEWDLSFSAVCVEHRCNLIDRCPKCNAAIRWERPSIEWGHCGHLLGGLQQVGQMADQSLLAQAILSMRLGHECVEGLLVEAGLFPWLAKLSVDGWMNLLLAFGLGCDRWAVARPGIFGKIPTTGFARDVVRRGMERLIAWSQSILDSEELAHFVIDVPLVRLIVEPSGEFDREILLRTFSMLYGSKAADQLKRCHPGLGQLSLFEDDA